jgi:hypothetical protein
MKTSAKKGFEAEKIAEELYLATKFKIAVKTKKAPETNSTTPRICSKSNTHS